MAQTNPNAIPHHDYHTLQIETPSKHKTMAVSVEKQEESRKVWGANVGLLHKPSPVTIIDNS